MKVGVLLVHPISGVLGYSIRSYELTRHLSQLGVEVHVFSPLEVEMKISNNLYYHHIPSLPTIFGLQDGAYKWTRKMAKTRIFLNSFLYRKSTLEWISENLAKKIARQVVKEKIDVMQGEASIPALALLALKKSVNVNVVTDLHDLWDEEEVLAGRISRDSLSFKVLRFFIRKMVIDSDLSLVGNEEIRKRIFNIYGVDAKYATKCPDIAPIVGGTIRPETRTKTNDIARVIYAGNFEPYEYVDLFVKSLPYLKKLVPQVRPLIVGTGPEEGKLRKLATILGFEDIFLGQRSRDDTFELCANCDVGVVPTIKAAATPLKLFDYMSVGLPVVSLKGMWWSQIVEKHQVGITADFSADSFADATAELLCADLNKYSNNAKNLVLERYNWYNVAKNILGLYDKLI